MNRKYRNVLIPLTDIENWLRDFGMEWGFTEYDDGDGGYADYEAQRNLLKEATEALNKWRGQ